MPWIFGIIIFSLWSLSIMYEFRSFIRGDSCLVWGFLSRYLIYILGSRFSQDYSGVFVTNVLVILLWINTFPLSIRLLSWLSRFWKFLDLRRKLMSFKSDLSFGYWLPLLILCCFCLKSESFSKFLIIWITLTFFLRLSSLGSCDYPTLLRFLSADFDPLLLTLVCEPKKFIIPFGRIIFYFWFI